jgi:hypothetical protein
MSSETLELPGRTQEPLPATVEIPAPTAWPIVLAFGVTLLFAGLLTSSSVSILGAIFALAGAVGWFREVLPHEQHESIPVLERQAEIEARQARVARVEWISKDLPRARLPLEIYPISAGIKGGLAGGVAMAAVAMLYGIVSGNGAWYAVNLLSAGFFPERSAGQLGTFSWDLFGVALILHAIISLVVGLLYGAMLPMFPRRPILLGGLITPILWSGLIHSILEIVNPMMNRSIHWVWFVISQIGFGLVAGIIVSKQERIRTWQYMPFAIRAGVEAPGAIDEKHGGKQAP